MPIKPAASRISGKLPTIDIITMPIKVQTVPAGNSQGFGMAVGVVADPGLQQRRGQLEGQGDQADLGERQAIVGLEHRVDRRQHRLNQVVDQVRQCHCADDAHDQRAAL